MNWRPLDIVLVVVVWAAIYLPALGALAIKGEEGRRILPAIAMLETGDYVVPEVGGKSYFRKPPLVNWLVAASFRVFGARNEWTARLPSALAVLSVAMALVIMGGACLSRRGAMLAACIWLTNVGMIEKGRLIEIEAVYVALCGLAIVFWLSFVLRKKSPWLIWIPASVFLGLGLLAKGPLHLAFFYAVVIAVLWHSREWRLLVHPAHFVGLAIMLGIFASWAVPFLHRTAPEIAMVRWSSQFTGRLEGAGFRFSSWVQNIPRSLFYFFPWVLLFPFVRFAKIYDPAQGQLARALAWGTAVPFVLVNLIPGGVARYSMPALVPASWLLALSFVENALQWPQGMAVRNTRAWAQIAMVFIGFGLAIGLLGYPIAAVVLRNRQQVKKAANQLNALVPEDETLYAVDPDYQPVFFYVRPRLKYVGRVEELPADARYFLVRAGHETAALATGQRARPVARVRDYSQREMILFEVVPVNGR